jgi:phosphate transport system substrate-binding protein
MGRRRAAFCLALAAAIAFGATPRGQAEESVDLRVEGTEFAKAFLDRVESDLASASNPLTVTFIPTGSGGRASFVNGAADLAFTEVPLSEDQVYALKAANKGFAYAPLSAGPVAFAYNVVTETDEPKVEESRVKDLKLSPPTIVKIFTNSTDGQAWTDPEITADNGKEVKAEPPGYFPIVRVGESGTNYWLTKWFIQSAPDVWRDYLKTSSVPPDVPQEQFPLPLPRTTRTRPSFDQVALLLADPFRPGGTAGGHSNIGYLAPVTAKQVARAKNLPPLDIPLLNVKNAAGNFVAPTTEAASKALAVATLNPDHTITPNVNPTDPAAYPLVVPVYAVVPTTGDPAKLAAIARFLKAVVDPAAQQTAASMGFAPLTQPMVDATNAVAAQLALPAAASTTTVAGSSAAGTTAANGVSSATGTSGGAGGGSLDDLLARSGPGAWQPTLAIGALLIAVGEFTRRRSRRRRAS